MAKHIHKYHVIIINGKDTWACAFGNCNHFMPDNMKNMVEGKFSICWVCEQQFTLNENNMQAKKPVCNRCAARFGISEKPKPLG